MRFRKHKGVAPNFVVGLKDMDLEVGNTAAVAGKLTNKSKLKKLINKLRLIFQKNVDIIYMNVRIQKIYPKMF